MPPTAECDEPRPPPDACEEPHEDGLLRVALGRQGQLPEGTMEVQPEVVSAPDILVHKKNVSK